MVDPGAELSEVSPTSSSRKSAVSRLGGRDASRGRSSECIAVQRIARSPSCRLTAHPARASSRRRRQALTLGRPSVARVPPREAATITLASGQSSLEAFPRRHRRGQRTGRARRADRRRGHPTPAAKGPSPTMPRRTTRRSTAGCRRTPPLRSVTSLILRLSTAVGGYPS